MFSGLEISRELSRIVDTSFLGKGGTCANLSELVTSSELLDMHERPTTLLAVQLLHLPPAPSTPSRSLPPHTSVRAVLQKLCDWLALLVLLVVSSTFTSDHVVR